MPALFDSEQARWFALHRLDLEANNVDAFIERCRKSGRLSPRITCSCDDHLPISLTSADRRHIEALFDRDELCRIFVRGTNACFARFKICGLLAAQAWMYQDALQRRLPHDAKALAEFCLTWRPASEPLILGDGTLMFEMRSPDDVAHDGVHFKTSPFGVTEMVIRVASQPNFMRVARIDSQYVLLNEYHRSAALVAAGFNEIIAMIAGDEDVARFFLRPDIVRRETVLRMLPRVHNLLDVSDASVMYVGEYRRRVRVRVAIEREESRL